MANKSIAIKPSFDVKGVAASILTNAEIPKVFISVWAGKIAVLKGPLSLMVEMRKAIKDEGMNGLPFPDTKNTKDKPTNNPDLYDYKGTNAKGDSVTKEGSVLNDLFDMLQPHIQDELDQVMAAKRDDKAKAGKWYGAGAYALITRQEVLESQRSSGRAMLKRMVQLWNRMLALGELPLIKTEYVTEETTINGKKVKIIAQVGKPIRVRSADLEQEPDKFRHLSVSQVLGIDLEKAIAEGGKFEDIVGNLGGAGSDDEVEGEENPITFDTMSDQLAHFTSFFEEVFKDPKQTGLLFNRLQSPSAAASRASVFALEVLLSRITSKPLMQKLYKEDAERANLGVRDAA